MGYTQLLHPWKLPYADGSFDQVICSGVLEHAPFPASSLMELNRVMAENGVIVITFLPNRLSYTELVARRIVKSGQHRRLYALATLKRILLDHGFAPIEVGHHQVLPSLAMGHRTLRQPWLAKLARWLFQFDGVCERIWPLYLFSANLYAVARKQSYM